MAKVSQPELKRFLDKRVAIEIQGGRKITGTLRGFDVFLNLVVDSAVEQVHPPVAGQKERGGFQQHAWVEREQCGTVVSFHIQREREWMGGGERGLTVFGSGRS